MFSIWQFRTRNLPIRDVMRGHVEIDANLYDRQSTEGETFRVFLQVDLPHRSIRTLVQLQLQKIEMGL